MKTTKYIVLALVWILSACTKPLDDVKIHLNTSFIEYMMQVEFVDAANPNLTVDNISMSIKGEDAAAVLELSGATDFDVVNGRITLILRPEYSPTLSDPVSFNITAKAPGYLPVNAKVYFHQDVKEQLKSISMLNLSSPPEGVAHVSASGALTGNALAEDLTVTVATGGSKKTGAVLNISAGTKFLDKDGNEISGSNVEVDITHFDPNGEAALSTFPGGFIADKVILEDGQMSSIAFVTAGFSFIDMEVSGVEVKFFSQPINAVMEVDPNVQNFETKAPIQIGDEVPIWSFDMEEGIWKYEMSPTVTEQNGKLVLDMDMDHLTPWNCDWPAIVRAADAVASASVSRQQKRGASSEGEEVTAESFYFEILLAEPGQPEEILDSGNVTLEDGSVIISRPTDLLSIIKVYRLGNNTFNKKDLVGFAGPFNSFDGPIIISINLGDIPEEICFKAQATCSDDSGIISPTAPMYYREDGDPIFSFLGYMRNGIGCTTKLEGNKLYEFLVTYAGQDYTEFRLINEGEINLNFEDYDCSNL